MTLREYCKTTGLNATKVYNYSKYKGIVQNRYFAMTFKDLPFCYQLSILQIQTNLKCIINGEVPMILSDALSKSAFKINSKFFAENIMDGFNLNNKSAIDKHLKIEHVQKLLEITQKFIQ